LIELRKYDEKLVVMVLFNNGSGEMGANAATASIADGQDVNGVLHGSKKRRLSPVERTIRQRGA
jgi:hypothetical protein